jgi:hypothetical protein
MSYELRTTPELFQIEFSGRLTADDLSALATELESAEATLDVVPDHVTVLERVTEVDVSGDAVRAVAAIRKARHFPNRFRSAIVASHTPHVGYARMFQTLNDHPQITIALFPEADAAYDWLRSPRGLGR